MDSVMTADLSLPNQVQPTPAVPEEAGIRRHSLQLMAATVVVGIGNYGFSLAVIWLLVPADFSEVSSLSSLLLVVGSASNAALPWVLARGIRRTAPGSVERRETVGFTILGAAICGGAAALLVVALSARYASPGAQIATAISAFSIFVAGVAVGYLQGLGRFVALSVICVVEVVIKLGLGMALAATSLHAVGAMTGTAIASTTLALYGLFLVRREARRPRREVVRSAGADTARIGSVQLAVSLLVTLDIIVGSFFHGRTVSLAGYQAMAMFSRLPFFASIAVSMVIFPRLSATDRGREFSRTVDQTITMYLAIASASAAIAATLPTRVLDLVLPIRYGSNAHLLMPLAIAGLAAGLINLTTTFFQAAGRFKAPLKVLAVGCVVGSGILSFSSSSVDTLAWAAAGTFGVIAFALLVCIRRAFPSTHPFRRCLSGCALTALYGFALREARSDVPLWLAGSFAVAGIAVFRTRRGEDGATGEESGTALGGDERKAVRRARSWAHRQRDLRWLSNKAANVMRPLTPPAQWEGLVTAISLAGSGPAVVVPKAARVVVIAPHPDDETIGCGGTLALLASAGSEVRVIIATDGEASLEAACGGREVARRRRIRAIAACERLGVRPPMFLGLPDAGLDRCSDLLDKLLAREIDEFEPDLVFAPWMLDGHPDHRAVALSVANLELPDLCAIWTYEVWASLPPNRLVDVSDWWDDKIAALNCHELDEADGAAHLALQRWRSLHGLAGRGYAEAFLALTPAANRRLLDGRPS
ncbi:MAG: phosphatidylinositol alpha-mannosyltransferase [Acidimicrobiaceae bacterium]|nr:phosphatidylinositol alpha-mannosyltransferase [Acidimicrobiaceae bacterium]